MNMKIDIIISNGRQSPDNNPRSVRLKEEDWVYICKECDTWEVFPVNTKKILLICWYCFESYEKYVPNLKRND